MIIEVIIFVFTFLLVFVVYRHKSIHRYFDKYDLKYVPGYPIFGNTLKSTFLKQHMVGDLNDVYKSFPNERYVGYIEATSPIIMIRDPELIKQVTVKDFDHFVDHKEFFPEDIEPLLGGSVFGLKGDRWRDMRTTLSPAFTGLKMRQMMPFMTEISKNIVEYLKENYSTDEDLDVNDLVQRYTNDVIASAGFGLQVNSLKDKENEFYTLGQSLSKFDFWQRVVMFIVMICPALAKFLKLSVFPKRTTKFFTDIVQKTIEFREKNNVERPDMIQLLMEASKGNLKMGAVEKDVVGFATVQEELKPQGKVEELLFLTTIITSYVADWSINELTGQVFIFFAAGFATTASALVMTIHELVLNPDAQETLYQEIRNFKEARGNLTYDNINELKYLDCVLNETMRKYAAALIMDRVCTKAYELPPPREGGKPFPLKAGDVVYNMVNTIHMDPQYFPDPEKYDPERFSDDNKHKIQPFTFMPFGMGPRNCIGSRFALLELKVLLFNLILNFKILKGPKTADPIVMEPSDFNIRATGGTFVRLEKRKVV